MEPAPYINAAFTPSAAPQGTSELDHLNKGLYAYVNAAHDPELKKQADSIFGRTVPFDNSEETATLLGRSWCSRTGYLADPVRYCRDNKLPLPPNWSGENAQLYTLIGQNYIGKAQEHFNNQKAAREKALADAQKDYTETMGELPSLLAKSIRSAGGEKGTPLTPQYLEKLTKYGAREGAIQSQQRAATAWMYMSAYMDDIDSIQSTGRDKLLDIANTLSDDKGQLDPHATAAFLMMMEDKATELQSTDSQFWADFADKFQNSISRTADQIGKAYTNKGKGWDSSIINPSFIVSANPELDPNWLASQDNEPDPTYNDPRVEKLYGYMQRAINTAIAPSEKAEWYAKLLSEMGGLVGESAIPMTLGIAASAATAGAGGGAFLAAAAGYGAGFAATAPSTINASIAEAYAQGAINPELYGTLEGIGQAAAENIGAPATSLKLFTKTAGKLTNWAASRTAGSRFLANQYARTTLNFLTAGAFESLTELGEEELGGYIGSRLNALAREMGATVSPQAYKLGETLSNMKAHEVAAIFGYSYALGLWGIPANYRSARTFAQNTDNLLKAGHTPATARDIQHRAFQTEDKIADIAANPNLSPEQKAEAIRKEEQDFCVYQQNKFNNEILSDPNLRSRLQKEGRAIRDEAEVALDVEHEADLQILKDNGILQAVIIPGQKYQVAFLEEGETKEDGTRAPGKLITQEWSRTQLTNWLMLQKNTRIEQDLRSFNSLLLAHAHAQSATPEETKTHFQNLGANRPLAALGELHKRGITPDFFRKAAEHALALQTQHENAGMSPQEAAQQPHPDFAGLTLGEVQNLSTDAATRKEQELATTGQLQALNATTDIEYGALNILRRDGTGLIKYVAGKANLLDILEERFEIDIKQRTRGNKQLADQLAQTLLHIQSHLPGNITLLDPAKKGSYTQSDFVEAYSKIAIGNFLLNQQNLPINPAGHRLVQNIARAVDTTRMFQTIGNAWLTYANSPEGKAHLAESGHSIADIMREAGFTFSNQIAQARATADQRTEVLQASNWQPAIEEELDALLEDIEAEEQLSEINQQEANQPTTIPAEESITGQEIVIEPDASEATTSPASEATTTPEATSSEHGTSVPTTTSASEATTAPTSDLSGEKATTILSHMRDLIAKGKARAEHFAIVFREIPGLTEAQAIEQGIRPLTQRGEPTAAYTQGKLLAERCTDAQYLLLKSGKLTQKAKRDILGAPTQTRKTPAWPKIAKKGIAPAEQRLTIIKALQNAVDYAAENPNYNLNFTRHIISKGREYYVATDGRRLAVIERIAPKGSKDIEESLDKNGNVVKDAKFPESWRQVMIALTDKAQTLDLAPFRFLETYPKTAINHVVWQDSQGKLSKYNPNYIGKGIKFFSTLSKAIGSPSTIQVDNQNMGPILMQSDHDGWTAKYLLMPMRVVDGDIYKEGDILLTPQPSAFTNFSIKPAAADTLDRFTADPLGERIIHHIRTESRRYARLLGDKTPYEQAVNAAQSAASIIGAVDKYLHTPGKPVPARYRRQLQKLRSIAEKYAQIIASGTPRSFKKISPQEKQELETAIAELEAQELDTATTESDQLLTDSDRLTKREAAARAREHHRAIVRSAAKGRVYQTLSSMLEVTADALDSYLKHQLLQKLDRLTATVKIKRSPSKRLQGKMTAPAYRELERAINNMALSDRAYQDEIENVITAHETLARAINQGNTNLTSGHALLIQLADQLTTSGQQVTPQTLTAALANHEAALKIYGNVSSKTYEQTLLMANALFYLIRNGRNQWKAKHEAREARIQSYLRYFLAHTTPESETSNAKRNKAESRKWKDALSLDITMNAAQTIMALSSYEALRPLMQDLLANYSTAAVARQKHLQEIRKQELYAFGRIIGITPATQAGYTDKQLKELSDKFDTFYAENNQTVETTITPTRLVRNAAGELEHSTSAPLKLTKWEALNLILTYRQEHYQPNAQEHGFTPEILTQLENFIGQQMMDYGNAIQQILVNDGTLPVYEEREGIPMRDNPLYWPGHININTINTTRDEPLVNPYHPAASHDFLHARVRNRQEVGNRNAFGVFRKAIADRANYVYADPVTDTITSLLARDQFANRLETLIGGSLKRQLQTLINEIKGAAWQETSLQDATSGLISAAFGAKSLAVLSGNPSSLIRQFSAVANAGLMPGISPQQYLAYAIKAKQNQSHISFTDILKLDAFTTRKRDNAYVNEMIAMGADATFSTLMNWAKTGINAMDKLDLYANAFSATVIYNIKYDQLKAQGTLTEEQIRKRCEQEVAIYTKLLAQPLNRVDKSALYWMIGHHAIGRSILFMGSEAINKVGMLRANYITLRNQGKNPASAALTVLATMGVTVGIAASITEAALALLLGRTPDDDDSTLAFALALWLNASYGQYLSVIPLLGGVTDTVFSPYGGYLGNESVLPGSQLFTRDIGKLHTMLTDDKEYSVQQWNKEINRFMRNFTTILGYAGGANSQWQIYSSFAAFCQSLTAALNAEGFIFNVAANLTDTADEKTRRPKSLIEQWLTPATEESPRRATSRRRTATRSRTTARKRKRQEE